MVVPHSSAFAGTLKVADRYTSGKINSFVGGAGFCTCANCSRYGGKTGMAVLAPFGFKETTSDDWVLILFIHVFI